MSARFLARDNSSRSKRTESSGSKSSRGKKLSRKESSLKPFADDDDPLYDEDGARPVEEPAEEEPRGVLGKLKRRWKKKAGTNEWEDVDGYENAQGRFNIAKWGKDIILYLVFLALFTSVMFMGRGNSKVFAFASTWRSVLREHTDEISKPDDILAFLETFLEGGLLSPSNLDSGYTSTSSFSGGLYDSILVGNIRVRQKRVRPVVCSAMHSKLVDRGNIVRNECYPKWSPGAEDDTFTKQEGTPPQQAGNAIFTFMSAAQTGQAGLHGFYGYYSGSGFVAEMNSDSVSEVLAAVRETRWLDLKTRALLLDFILYSPQLDMFLLVQGLFEVLPGGAVQPSLRVRGLFVDRYPIITTTDRAKVFGEVVVYMFVLYFIVEEFQAGRRQGFWRRYMSQLDWVHLDVLNLLLLLLAGTYKMSSISRYAAAFGAEAQYEEDAFPGLLTALAAAIEAGDLINGINAFLLWLKVFKYAIITRRLLRLVSTVQRSLKDIAAFALLFSVVAYAFAVMGHLLLLQELPSHVSITSAAVSMLRNAMAQVDFKPIMQTAGTWGFLYLLAWMVASKTVLLNVVIAILNDAYTRALEWERSNPQETTYEKVTLEVKRRHREGRFKVAVLEHPSENKEVTEAAADKRDKQNFDPHFDAKKRLGWVTDQTWKPYDAKPNPAPNAGSSGLDRSPSHRDESHHSQRSPGVPA